VAILAGFYTTKIISISNERIRISMKINEIKLEVNSRKKYVGDLDSRIGDIRNAQDQDLIESFEKYVTGNFLVFEKIATWEDLLQAFTDYFGQLPSENLQKVLEKQSHDIL
jgi:hypothetical protein